MSRLSFMVVFFGFVLIAFGYEDGSCGADAGIRTERRLENLPKSGMTDSQIQQGGFIVYIIGIVYMFFAIREVTYAYLVTSVNTMVEHWGWKKDSIGGIFYSLCVSMPEIFIVSFSTYLTDNTLGLATVYGSAAVKGTLCLGICCLVDSKSLELQWWLIVRDSVFNMLSLSLLVIFTWSSSSTWWEGLILLFFYVLYSAIFFHNKRIERSIKKYLRIPYDGDEIDYHPLPERVFPIRRYSITDLQEFIPPKLNFKKGVLAKMIRNAQLQVVKSHSERLMELRAKLKNIFYIILRAIEEKKRCARQNRLDRKVIQRFEDEDNSGHNPLQEEVVSRIKKLESIRTEEAGNQQQIVKVVPRGSRIKHYVLLPLTQLLRFTIPNSEKYPKFAVFGVVMGIVWNGFLCFLLVWWIIDVARGLGIPNGLMGIIFVTAGINVPDVIAAVVKVTQGEGELMLSNLIRPNVINFTLAVGMPWFFYGVSTGKALDIDVAINKTAITLIAALGCSYVFIGGFKWKLSKSLGVVLIFFYFTFLLFFLLFEFNQL